MAGLDDQELPRCARCLRPVDRVVVSLDPHTGTRTYTAFCHGARESVDVTEEDQIHMQPDASGAAFRFTVAFSRTRKAEQGRRDVLEIDEFAAVCGIPVSHATGAVLELLAALHGVKR